MKKRQSNKGDANADAARADDSSLAAWESNPQAQALRVDLQNGAFFILPYSQFAFAHLEREDDSETLRISFTTHDVRVSGRSLRELGIALQKLAVEWIREVPKRYAALAEKGGTAIERIEITEVNEDDSPH